MSGWIHSGVYGCMTLWDLLTLIVFMEPIIGACVEAKHSEAGILGYFVASLTGLGLGVGCAWVMGKAGVLLDSWTRDYSRVAREWAFGSLYLAGVLLAFFGVFLGGLTVHPLMRFLH